jgi:methyl-accepting chemotaxis protein
MFKFLTKISIRTLLSLLIATLGLLLIGQSIAGLAEAYRLRQDARQVALLSRANTPVLAAMSHQQHVRDLVAEALSADAPISEAAFAEIDQLRRQVDQNYTEAIARFSEPGLPVLAAVVDRLRSAHETILKGRPALDAALHLPKVARDRQLAQSEPFAVQVMQQAINTSNGILENAVQWIDPWVDNLLNVRRAAYAARQAAHAITTRIQTALIAQRPWTRADLAQHAADRVRIALAWKTIENAVNTQDATPLSVDAINRAKELYRLYEANEQQPLVAILRSGRLPEVNPSDFKTHGRVAADSFAAIADTTTQAISAHTDDRRRHAQTSLMLHVGALIIALTGTLVGLVLVYWRISLPIERLTGTMGRLTQKDRARGAPEKLPGDGRCDEIGNMAAALHVFREEMVRGDKLAALTAAQTAAEAQRATEIIAQLSGMAKREGEIVKTLIAGLIQLAEGNLAFSLPKPLDAAHETMRTLFNDAVTGLQGTVRDVLTRAQTIGRGTTEIAHGADDLARRTQQQAASLKQTAAALAEITATVRQTADGSARAQLIAATARADAETSARVVTQTIAAMEQIDGSAREIGQIVGLIDEIAFQTNLLALNAGVEAARAGDSGRGFAVIASEVRALAQRASGAASEITALVQTSMNNVERGVRLVGETGQALGRIQASVIDISVAINEIAAAVQEQSSSLAEVSQTVNQMDHVTQQNATMVEQTTAATFALAQETQELGHAMERFTIESREPVAAAA